jgi:septal ring-binding cell division protein DamX
MRIRVIVTALALLIMSCGSDVEPKTISINKTQKVQSTQNWDTAEELRFLWTPPSGPEGNQSNWIVNGDIMLFTPDIPGKYAIALSVEDQSGDVLNEEDFLFIAIIDTMGIPPISPKIETDVTSESIPENNLTQQEAVEDKPSISKTSSTPSGPYTLQIAAWPSLEEARKDQLELQKLGFDAYTQRTFVKSKDAIWWRVRIGNFSNLEKANQVKIQIENLRGKQVWVDKLRSD